MVSRSKRQYIELRSLKDGEPKTIATIALDGETRTLLQKEAMRWRYIVRQRSRWSQDDSSRSNIEASALSTLNSLGVTNKMLELIAVDLSTINENVTDAENVRIIEVAIPWTQSTLAAETSDGPRTEADVETLDADWAARIMPWEHLITAATKRYRRGRKMVVVRRLVVPRNRIRKLQPSSYSILVAAPGALGNSFDFGNEVELLQDSLSVVQASDETERLKYLDLHEFCGRDPDIKLIEKWIAKQKPGVLHVTGVDLRLGSQLLDIASVPKRDGIFLGSKSTGAQSVLGESFAAAIASENSGPELVTFNLWHSGARIAPATIAAGARAAIGFEHTFDDSIAELFFSHFYEKLLTTGWDLVSAFHQAIDVISPYQDRIRGSSIILWTRDSLLKSQKTDEKRARPSSTLEKIVRAADPSRDDVSQLLQIEAEPVGRINYASLHNKGSLLEHLVFKFKRRNATKVVDGKLEQIDSIQDLNITVTLCAGSDTFPYRTRIAMTDSERVVDLAQVGLGATKNHAAGGIFVPLTSELLRTVDESMLTNIHVLVEWHTKVLYNQTFSVKLAPVDEWRFEEDEIVWMPSFVQPRDPAISRIVDSAQRYLACLRDDYTVGFDGYQSYDPDAEDPWGGIDDQVQSIWTAISMDYDLKYINPPPSYSDNAQRLRTPSRILHEKRGTCVDLALLFASCLEWIEIYPVIFNLDDHAFPGYWRDLSAYERFRKEPKLNPDGETAQFSNNLRFISRMLKSWYSERDVYGELRNYVSPIRKANEREETYERRRSLVPIETVYLTNNSGFQAAKEAAREYFAKVRGGSFHSLIDIVNSRSSVTPIPLSSMQERG